MNRIKHLSVIFVCLFISIFIYHFETNGITGPENQSIVPLLVSMIAIPTIITAFIAYLKIQRDSPTSSSQSEAQTQTTSTAASQTSETDRITTEPTNTDTPLLETTTLEPLPWINRETLQKIFQQSDALHLPEKYALVLLEAPNFKELISTLGYRQSDQLVLQVASKLNQKLSTIPGAIALPIHTDSHQSATPNLQSNQLPSNQLPPKKSSHLTSDTVIYISHLAYCQFAFFLDCTDRDDQAVGRTRMILNELKSSALADILPIYSNPCAGIAFSSPQNIDFYELLRQSQIAASQAIENYHRIERYQPTLAPQAKEKTLLMGELKRAIEIDALEIRYQPQISLDHKNIIGIEALVHWNHPEFGLLPSHKFIPIAESTGLIKNLTEWTIDQVMRDAALALSVMPELNISINISPYSLLQPNFSFYLHEKISEEQIPTQTITLEIQENVILKKNPMTNKIIQNLKQNNFNLSIDDFGTGYGSLKHLRDSPVSQIKINQIFIKDLEKHKTDQTIVKSIINMSHNMGITVVAEGIETSQTFELLKTFNCDTGQGALFSEPVKISELLEQLVSTSNLYSPQIQSSSQ
ncbi:MAG: hypothetical protein COB51_00310 [Moraxellaceae bacterium]|nr:MAG: hypothetical protein COB51_00310 [Moraxellaceae bacterium]